MVVATSVEVAIMEVVVVMVLSEVVALVVKVGISGRNRNSNLQLYISATYRFKHKTGNSCKVPLHWSYTNDF